MGDDPQLIKGLGNSKAKAPFALPSLSCLKEILRRAADTGRVTWSPRFKRRCAMHGFDTVDAVNVVREGRIIGFPEFDHPRNAWRIDIADSLDGHTLVVMVALGCGEDFSDLPRVEILTAYYRRGRNREVKEWANEHDETEGG